jgi:3-oxoacyl-[acyl-carrier protein] reductase
MTKLTGKVAIVTASSRGIGRAVALRLGRDGAAVAVNYVASPDKAHAVVQEIESQGGRAIAIQGSVANQADVLRLFDETEQKLGAIDIVVNVAGVSVFKPHNELTDEDFEKVFSVNAKGAMYMLQAAANRVKDGGRIVQFSTGGTMMPIPAGGIYAASKAAGERFAFALSKEIGYRQVTVVFCSLPSEKPKILEVQTNDRSIYSEHTKRSESIHYAGRNRTALSAFPRQYQQRRAAHRCFPGDQPQW